MSDAKHFDVFCFVVSKVGEENTAIQGLAQCLAVVCGYNVNQLLEYYKKKLA